MRDATVRYLQKSFNIADDLKKDGKKAEVFGTGTEDVIFTRSGVFTELVPSARNNCNLEYHDVTIPAGISILGHPRQEIRTENSLQSYPFYLKVSGTLTVNGILNMNGAGQPGYPSGGFHSNHNCFTYTAFTQTGLAFPPVPQEQKTITEAQWKALYNSGVTSPFYNGQTYLFGAGSCKAYHWNHAGHTRKRRARSSTALNSGGDYSSEWGRYTSGGGGGFLALYYDNLDYQGPSYEGYPLHINANGGSFGGNDGAPNRWGGGCMIIVAKNIVVGPQGYICCNPSFDYTRSNAGSPVFGDSTLNAGGLALMNRPVYGGYYKDYNGGYPISPNWRHSGGPGVCFGYQINEEYRKQNR